MGADVGTESGGIGLPGRMVRVLYAPGETFEAVSQRHGWLDWFAPALVTALVATASVQATMPLLVKAQQEALAKVAHSSALTPQQQEQQQQMLAKMSGVSHVAALVMAPLSTFAIVFILGGVMLAIGRFVLGGEPVYGQTLAVAGYTSLIGVVQTAVMTPLRQAKGAMIMTLGPGLLLPDGTLTSFAGRLANAVDVFVLWQVGVAAVGLAIVSRAATGKALACLLVVWALVVLASAFLGRFMPGA